MNTGTYVEPTYAERARADRVRVAWHESGHATSYALLFGPGRVTAVSIRRGKSHAGVTMQAPVMAEGRERGVDISRPGRESDIAGIIERRERELDIIATLAGRIAERLADPTAVHEDTGEAAATATASLDKLAPLIRRDLLHAEAAEPEDTVNDATMAERQAAALAWWGDRNESEAHLHYLTYEAAGFVGRHHRAIERVARALLLEHTLDGATVERLVYGSRCVCHGWTPPDRTEDAAAGAQTPDLSPPQQ